MEPVIIVFKANTASSIVEAAISQVVSGGGKVGHRYESSIIGFSASLPTSLLGKLTNTEEGACREKLSPIDESPPLANQPTSTQTLIWSTLKPMVKSAWKRKNSLAKIE